MDLVKLGHFDYINHNIGEHLEQIPVFQHSTMESDLALFISNNKTDLIFFKPLSDFEGLPYPLYLACQWKNLITILQVAALASGLKLHWIIFKCLKSPESNGPLNRLIWMDQINGLFLGAVLAIKIFAMNSPNSLNELLGEEFCQFFDLMGTLNAVGSVTWTCFIAFFRIGYIKAQNWIKANVGEMTLLNLLLGLGVILNFGLALLLVTFDSHSSGKKICKHLSGQDIKIIQQYEVIILYTLESESK